MRAVLLPAVRDDPAEYEAIEREIKRVLRALVYLPLLHELGFSRSALQNSRDDLIKAVERGTVTFDGKIFRGHFSTAVTMEIRKLGVKWEGRRGVFILFTSSVLPADLVQALAAAESTFLARLGKIDRRLAKLLPAEIADKIKVTDIFDKALWKADKSIEQTLKDLTVVPKLTDEARRRLAEEWQNNMELAIKDFANSEIVKLRKAVQESVFKGNRHEALVSAIQTSYGVSASKAKFLARQETSLLMAKFKETRYVEAGVNWYKWGCVIGSPNHPVRPAHKKLDGKIFRWDNPPITSPKGQTVRRNNPKQDYNCRCFARPLVNYKGTGSYGDLD